MNLPYMDCMGTCFLVRNIWTKAGILNDVFRLTIGNTLPTSIHWIWGERSAAWRRKQSTNPCERDSYLDVCLESQTTNPNHQLTISIPLEIPIEPWGPWFYKYRIRLPASMSYTGTTEYEPPGKIKKNRQYRVWTPKIEFDSLFWAGEASRQHVQNGGRQLLGGSNFPKPKKWSNSTLHNPFCTGFAWPRCGWKHNTL